MLLGSSHHQQSWDKWDLHSWCQQRPCLARCLVMFSLSDCRLLARFGAWWQVTGMPAPTQQILGQIVSATMRSSTQTQQLNTHFPEHKHEAAIQGLILKEGGRPCPREPKHWASWDKRCQAVFITMILQAYSLFPTQPPPQKKTPSPLNSACAVRPIRMKKPLWSNILHQRKELPSPSLRATYRAPASSISCLRSQTSMYLVHGNMLQNGMGLRLPNTSLQDQVRVSVGADCVYSLKIEIVLWNTTELCSAEIRHIHCVQLSCDVLEKRFQSAAIMNLPQTIWAKLKACKLDWWCSLYSQAPKSGKANGNMFNPPCDDKDKMLYYQLAALLVVLLLHIKRARVHWTLQGLCTIQVLTCHTDSRFVLVINILQLKWIHFKSSFQKQTCQSKFFQESS